MKKRFLVLVGVLALVGAQVCEAAVFINKTPFFVGVWGEPGEDSKQEQLILAPSDISKVPMNERVEGVSHFTGNMQSTKVHANKYFAAAHPTSEVKDVMDNNVYGIYFNEEANILYFLEEGK